MKKTCLLFCLLLLVFAVSAALAEVPVDDAAFPDRNFQAYVREHLDTDKNGVLSEGEIAEVKILGLGDKNIKDLKGLEFFTELEILDCSLNELSSLDVSNNVKRRHQTSPRRGSPYGGCHRTPGYVG